MANCRNPEIGEIYERAAICDKRPTYKEISAKPVRN